jgi:RNA polymerase sigma-70 factor (ECF subfamily)
MPSRRSRSTRRAAPQRSGDGRLSSGRALRYDVGVDATARAALEQDLAALHAAADWRGAATLALRGYGPELLGFLVGMYGSDVGNELFSQLCEDVWRGLPTFERRASFRTWLYTLAHHAGSRFMRGEAKRQRRRIALDDAGPAAELAVEVRTRTMPILQTEVKSKWRALRESLPREDQLLLVLRVDKGLEWNELVDVLHEGEAPLDAEDKKREAARLRKRFQVVKERLREMGRRAGLLSDGDGGRDEGDGGA